MVLPSARQTEISFPGEVRRFQGRVTAQKGEVGEVSRMAPENACSADMLALIRWQGRNVAVPLSQLVPLDAGESTIEAIRDWHYWVARGYRF
jgi:Calcium binding